MTLKELARHDGRDGRKAYVAVNGKVYDFTDSPLWQAGSHQGEHRAGCDLSEALWKAPHVRSVVERYPVVGKLEQEPAPARGGSGTVKLALAALAIILVVTVLLLTR
ncbi:MAG: hypothetical protein C0617_03145 [Desulfuromonas sp.]|uniref:cytochrome b5 domain-containing protein n=1 Tax=Desulfuromonas sp. TaxID=892 RepID=UPI000CC68CEE|nr:cytochrome b5 domain-containing protein [Desulfuromonas sp.]PLX85692.1 MAG: hypothetical protein C0617_03145 [Desulfuromonas sp.]